LVYHLETVGVALNNTGNDDVLLHYADDEAIIDCVNIDYIHRNLVRFGND